MATGDNTYKGLAVPLYGESTITQQTAADDMLTLTGATSMAGDFLVCETGAGTERVWINADGCIYSRGATVTSTAYLGLDARGTVGASATGTWFATIGGRLTTSLTSSSGVQQYAINGHLVTTGANTGGRDAVLNLIYSYGNSQAAAAASFINFDDQSTDVPTLFTMPGVTPTSGGCFVTNTQGAATHAFKIYVGGTIYYLMATDTA